MKKERVFPCSIIIISIVLLLYNNIHPVRKSTIIGPVFWPNLILSALIILGTTELIKSLRVSNGKKTMPPENSSNNDSHRYLYIFFSIALYILTLPFLGFFISSFMLFTFISILFGLKKSLAPIIGLISIVVLMLLFYQVLHISLPRGIGIFESLSSIF